MPNAGPLSGIKVLDLTRLAPGPHCTMILGDLGAEVIKIEEAGPPTGRRAEQAGAAGVQNRVPAGFGSTPFNALNRNKKSLALNLKSPAGKQIFLRLAQRADVVVEEFRPGVAKRLGIGYDTLSVRSPRVIYCAITGYGQTGPYQNVVGHDINYIATAGALSLVGRKGQPPAIPQNWLADYAGGGMHAALGIMAALLARQQTGRGQMVDISMLDGTMMLLAQTFSTYYASGRVREAGDSVLDGAAPFYNVYRCKDGKWVTIGAMEPWFYANLCRALGHEEFIGDQYKREKYAEMHRVFEEVFLTKTRDEWCTLLNQSDICVGPVLTLDEVENHPQVKARNMIVEVDGPEQKVKQIGISIKLSETPGAVRWTAPAPGQHTEEILLELGYTESAIAKWREEGAVR